MPHAKNQFVPYADYNYSHFKSSKQKMYILVQITASEQYLFAKIKRKKKENKVCAD